MFSPFSQENSVFFYQSLPHFSLQFRDIFSRFSYNKCVAEDIHSKFLSISPMSCERV